MRPLPKVLIFLGLSLFHFGTYFLINSAYAFRPTLHFQNFELAVDRLLPYWPWTWSIYVFGFLYSSLGAAFFVWNFPKRKFFSAFIVFTGMFLAGAVIHLFIPSRAPWPETMALLQRVFKQSLSIQPFACFPSMHVSTAVLTACLSLHTLRSNAGKTISLFLAVLISLSTLTAKEHYVLDVLGGLALACLFYGIWRIMAISTRAKSSS